MTPTLSLLVVCALVAGTTVARGKSLDIFSASSKNNINWTSIGELTGWFLFIPALVWIFDRLLWPDWPESLSALALLIIISLLAGFGVLGIMKLSYKVHIPANPLKKRQAWGQSGIIRMQKLGPSRGKLPEGVKMVWDEKEGGWTMPEKLRADESDAMAS